jgi:hypothetical protein
VTTVNEYVPYGTIRITCRCCKLPQIVRDRDGAKPTMCDECHRHQGQLTDKRLARAESHEAMLRERLTACRGSEARARNALETASEKVAAALDSRNWLADRLVSAAEGNRKHDCPAQQLARDSRVVEFADKYRERHGNRRGRSGGWQGSSASSTAQRASNVPAGGQDDH